MVYLRYKVNYFDGDREHTITVRINPQKNLREEICRKTKARVKYKTDLFQILQYWKE